MRENGFKQRMLGSVLEMDLYGVIDSVGGMPDDDFIIAREVNQALKDAGKVDKLRVFVNSAGGDVYDGFAIANQMRRLREEGRIKSIEMNADGLVASAATLFFLEGDDRIMRNGSRFMIHKPWSFGMGNADDFRANAARMDQTEEEALDLYEKRSSMSRVELRAKMDAETFYTAKEALNAGFATQTEEQFAQAACMSDLMRQRFKHLPDGFEVKGPAAMEREKYEQQLATFDDSWLKLVREASGT